MEQQPEKRILVGATLATLAVAAVVVGVAALLAGAPGALGAALGTLLAVAFFAVTLVVLGWVTRYLPELLVGAALGSYVAKVVALGVLLVVLEGTTAFDRTAFALATVVGACVFLVAEVRLVARARIPYVDAEPPTGSRGSGR